MFARFEMFFISILIKELRYGSLFLSRGIRQKYTLLTLLKWNLQGGHWPYPFWNKKVAVASYSVVILSRILRTTLCLGLKKCLSFRGVCIKGCLRFYYFLRSNSTLSSQTQLKARQVELTSLCDDLQLQNENLKGETLL